MMLSPNAAQTIYGPICPIPLRSPPQNVSSFAKVAEDQKGLSQRGDEDLDQRAGVLVAEVVKPLEHAPCLRELDHSREISQNGLDRFGLVRNTWYRLKEEGLVKPVEEAHDNHRA
jgi:hypothetical protein